MDARRLPGWLADEVPEDDPKRPVLSSAAHVGVVGVALPATVQPRAIISADAALRLGAELIALALVLQDHAELVQTDMMGGRRA